MTRQVIGALGVYLGGIMTGVGVTILVQATIGGAS